jgi:phosphate transport system ATP-binding protein
MQRATNNDTSTNDTSASPSTSLPILNVRPDCCENPAPLFHIENLTVKYGSRTAVHNVNMEIPAGCVTALFGPSGCGKTTFLHALNRMTDLIETCSVTGTIRLGDDDIRAANIDVVGLRRRIGMIFQKPNPFPLTIRRNITFPLKHHGMRLRADLDHAMESALRDVGLWDEVRDRLDSPALRLSGGQQQRLCLARAIALRPEVLLLDEPCSALDPIASGVVEDLIDSLRARYTVIIVTHNLAQARRLADDAALFWIRDGAGHLIEFGRAREMFASPKHELTAAYIADIRG